MALPPSALAVSDEVQKLLRAAGVRGQIPTPKSQILACTRLVGTGELDLALYEESIAKRATSLFYKAINKVRGFFDRRTKQLYIDPGLRDTKRTFVTYHEVIHKIATWQHIQCTEDDDLTINVDCETLFEAEANYGAAEILGAVGIENNNDRNFKDLRGMLRNTKSLKRNVRARKEILIAPSKLPRFPLELRFSLSTFHTLPATNVGFGPKIRGTDGKPANSKSEAWEASILPLPRTLVNCTRE
jgi:hypothetical protein